DDDEARIRHALLKRERHIGGGCVIVPVELVPALLLHRADFSHDGRYGLENRADGVLLGFRCHSVSSDIVSARRALRLTRMPWPCASQTSSATRDFRLFAAASNRFAGSRYSSQSAAHDAHSFEPVMSTVRISDADRKSTRLNSSHVKISYAVY